MNMDRKSIIGLILIGSLASPLIGATRRDGSACSTNRNQLAIELAKHRDNVRRRGPVQALTTETAETVGNIALIEGDANIIVDPNAFDLKNVSLAFNPLNDRATRYREERDDSVYEPALGTPARLGDDDSRVFDLAFEFPFFGQRYQQVFVNSDGNLTFGQGDNASTGRDLGRFLSGAPRIALFFADLNPELNGQLRVANLPDRFVVSWDAVPEFGTTLRNTVQVVIEPSGRIVCRYSDRIDSSEAVLGVSAGGSPSETNLVDLSGEPFEGGGAIAERFAPEQTFDYVNLARKFYQSFPDNFDQIVIWTAFPGGLQNGAFAFQFTVANAITGIGDDQFSFANEFGSAGRLSSYVQMGNVRRYPASPDAPIAGVAGNISTLALLAHESGHRWLATIRFDRLGLRSDELLGRQLSHWSFFFDTDASFLEGNDIEEQSPSLFKTVAKESRYSSLDLYLMGLAPTSEVGPMFYITSSTGSREATPEVGVTIAGTKHSVSLDDVVRAEGARRPDFDSSQKEWRQAWLILYRPGSRPSAEEIARIEAARAAWEPFFNEQTLGRGTVFTTLGR